MLVLMVLNLPDIGTLNKYHHMRNTSTDISVSRIRYSANCDDYKTIRSHMAAAEPKPYNHTIWQSRP